MQFNTSLGFEWWIFYVGKGWIYLMKQKNIPSNLKYKLHLIQKLRCFLSRLAVVFAQSIEARR